jgi:uncharacterized RmlC-like cupin family protein
MTQGVIRGRAFESEDVVFSQTRLLGGVMSGWHHHGGRHLYAFVVSGTLRLEYRLKGTEFVELEAGDFIHLAPGLVHCDVNPRKGQELVIVNILVGKGPPVTNVDWPSGLESGKSRHKGYLTRVDCRANDT